MKPTFSVIIAGSRTFDNYALLEKTCNKMLAEKRKTHEVTVLCGEAAGADLLGKKYAEANQFAVASFPANWKEYGKKAGMLRNKDMAAFADALIAFWDEKSPGTGNMIDIMRKAGKPVQVVKFAEAAQSLPPKQPHQPLDAEWAKNFAKQIPEEIIEKILMHDELPSDPFAQECFRAGVAHAMTIIARVDQNKSKGLLDD